VFTKTAGVRRPSIQDGVRVIRNLGQANGFTVTVTADAAAFTAGNLATYRAVVFLNTTGDVLNAAQESAFEGYVNAGGGYVGVHAAAETEPDWAFCQNLVGAKVSTASPVSTGTVNVADRAHPSTETVPRTLTLTEEWYNFTANVRGVSHVLATVDERTFGGGSMGFDHPIAWCKDYQGGRSWYTGLGHSIESYRVNSVRNHLLGGIRWAAGVVEGDCGATVLANYEKVTLNDEPGEPMSLAVLPDGRVLHNTRGGQVRLYDPTTGGEPGSSSAVCPVQPGAGYPRRHGRAVQERPDPRLRRGAQPGGGLVSRRFRGGPAQPGRVRPPHRGHLRRGQPG
jgi:type 1 glutamine amidotransferase